MKRDPTHPSIYNLFTGGGNLNVTVMVFSYKTELWKKNKEDEERRRPSGVGFCRNTMRTSLFSDRDSFDVRRRRRCCFGDGCCGGGTGTSEGMLGMDWVRKVITAESSARMNELSSNSS
ncbi:hypothetical protein QJS04_geneDACA004364 [Acorus gramineus]|uniref:Uncharacterized protein n=1 Tax=Acorus gramineus TaxID=55184 RepID=A0AAV9B393_ACOGR|nr:hypothetical protein QJS04_geneDACA004364 [Acorus gramineus]